MTKILIDTGSHVALLVAVFPFMDIVFSTIQKLNSVLPKITENSIICNCCVPCTVPRMLHNYLSRSNVKLRSSDATPCRELDLESNKDQYKLLTYLNQ